MLQRMYSSIMQNKLAKELSGVLLFSMMIIVVVIALLMMQEQEIDFVYANF